MDQILNLFMSNAYADPVSAVAGPGAQGSMSFIMMFVIFFLFIYFAVWRPQNKRAKEVQSLLSSLTKGDEVVTVGGILGRISKISDQYISLTIAGNVEMQLQKSAIASVLPKGTLKSIE